jgi:hypothetical protein
MLTPRHFINAQIAAAATVYYAAAAAVRARIDALTVVNTTGGAVTFSVWLVPTGGAPDNTNILVKDRSIAAGSAARVLEAYGQWLDRGGSIYMSCSTALAITANASGLEQTTS